MLKGPSRYCQVKFPERSLKRRNTVLKLLRKNNVINIETAKLAMNEPLGVLANPTSGVSPFPAYLDLVKRQLLEEYRESDLRSSGLRIFTALDPQIQLAAEKTFVSEINRIEAIKKLPKNKLEVSAVVSSTSSNEVLALVGGRTPRYKGFNRALDSKRPIGSLIKPAIFLTALSLPEKYTLVSRINDTYISVKNPDGSLWAPKNYDRKYHGNIPLYLALINSYNASTVRIGLDVGLPSVFQTLEEMGFTRETQMYPASLLGSVEMSSFEVTQMYQTLASGGFYSSAKTIRAIYKPDGQLLQRYPLNIQQNFNAAPVYLLNKILQAVITEGTGRSLAKIIPNGLGVAGKTGTTNDLKDSWFAGFTGDHLAAVWVGRDDNKSCRLTGSSGAMKLWGKLMANIPNKPLILTPPENVEWVTIDNKTGLRTDKSCKNAMAFPFIRGSAPEQMSNCIKVGKVETERKKEKINKQKNAGSEFIHWLKDLF